MFEIIGLLSLMCFSFMVTEKTSLVVKNTDEIMIKIKEESINYFKESEDAIIKDDSIIPGICGKKVNIDKSYKNMKKYGIYNEELYIYDEVLPKISIKDNIDKYIIGGNPKKRLISLIFYLENDEKIDKIINVLNKNNIKANFFIDEKWLSSNTSLVLELINNGHIIGNLSNNLDYSSPSFEYINTIIKNIGNQKNGYCYYTNNKENLKICSMLNNYTIKPIEIKNNPYKEVKTNLKTGMIFSFKINDKLEREIGLIIEYIKSKGYKIVTISDLIEEN